MSTLPAEKTMPRKTGSSTSALLAGKAIPGLSFLVGLAAVLAGCVMLVDNPIQVASLPILAGLSVMLMLLFMDVYRQYNSWDFKIAGLALLVFAGLGGLYALPQYITGWQLNAVFDRSLFDSLVLVVTGLLALSICLYYLWGATPAADDIAHYPLILLPVLFVLVVYLALIGQLLVQGLPTLSWSVLSKPFLDLTWPSKTTIDNGWPAWTTIRITQPGLLNHLEGTGWLMLLTTLFALPFGAGAGVYLSEYASGAFAGIARFTITALRAISTFVLGLTALSLARSMDNTLLAGIFRGTYFDGYGTMLSNGGSFLVASFVLALLVIPIIARSTEEGCRSLPPELREGSLALGASDQTTLFRIVLPWAFPNILTAVILGCAEAAGSVAVLMFIAGRGVYGVGPLRQVTSLAYLVFDIWFGDRPFKGNMGAYQFSAGVLLLLITMTMGIIAMFLKRRLVKRHRGGA
ncbi:MAG: ABC transporter permease subunit [Anaerolineales bacterium]